MTSGCFLGDCAWFLCDLNIYIPAKIRPQKVAPFLKTRSLFLGPYFGQKIIILGR